jgi:tellurite resistance protein TehA-like permease
MGRVFEHQCIGEADMPKAVRISAPISAPISGSTTSAAKSESHPLVSLALFSGIGLLVSLIAVLMGVQGVWY